MRGSRRSGRALAVAGLAAAVVASPAALNASPSVATTAASDDQPLQTAGRAAGEVSFVGVLQVRWSDGGVDHSETLLVQGGNGSVVVRGGTAVMASPQQRLVEHAGGEWDLLWPVVQGSAGRPAPSGKYQLDESPGPTVTSRATRVVEARQGGVLLERLYLDEETGLLLRREQFEAGSGPNRTIEFETLAIGGPTPAPSPPHNVVNIAPKVLSPRHLPAGVSAPAALPDSYQRVGLFRRSGVVQALYSDGLYDLSVFQQQGRLDHHGLPAGSKVSVRSKPGWHYAWPGGHVVVWEADGTVFTAVSDAPLGQVLTAVRSMPPSAGSPPFVRRLRQVCRALIQPLAA
jgi:sigma-E factor negative regulatory protein RseB